MQKFDYASTRITDGIFIIDLTVTKENPSWDFYEDVSIDIDNTGLVFTGTSRDFYIWGNFYSESLTVPFNFLSRFENDLKLNEDYEIITRKRLFTRKEYSLVKRIPKSIVMWYKNPKKYTSIQTSSYRIHIK